MKPNCSAARGFSLIELVVAIGIIGILAAIAIPSYTNYTQQARRTDATRSLATARQVLERCYTQYYAYNSANCPALAVASTNGYYTISTPAIAAATYTVTATAVGIQAKDTACATFSITNAGVQTSTGTATSQTCWGSN